jgi:hypothetical protein
VPDLTRSIASSTKNFPIYYEAGAYSGAKRQEDKVLQAWPNFAHSEMEFRQRPGIPVVFEVGRSARKRQCQSLLQVHIVPARQVRRIQQVSFRDLERSTYGYADGNNRSALPVRGAHHLLEPVYNLGEDLAEWFMRSREPLDSLDDPAIDRAFDARRLRAPDVETDNAAQSSFPN